METIASDQVDSFGCWPNQHMPKEAAAHQRPETKFSFFHFSDMSNRMTWGMFAGETKSLLAILRV